MRSTEKLYPYGFHDSTLYRYTKSVNRSRELYILVLAPGYKRTEKDIAAYLSTASDFLYPILREGFIICFPHDYNPVVNQETKSYKALEEYRDKKKQACKPLQKRE
ncbi:hypothetical protein RF11_11726 [Thelohanellus kitauei]|uniref:Uncharacterized protein n=1 Tax=Thelohanellus kitauei TaxID=669202 RepID=A0A0C2J1E8_THEKT|nr:hypothetical protein RF11_11726 [Thelohanellus kitauei]